MLRSLTRAAGFVLFCASVPMANAAPTYSVSICDLALTDVDTPQSIQSTCVGGYGKLETRARADTGSVGAYAKATHDYPGSSAEVTGGAGAFFYTDEIVVSTLPSAGTLPSQVYIALRFEINGILDVPVGGQARAQVIGALGTIAGNTSFNNGRAPEIYFYSVIKNESSGDVVKMVLETQKLLVNVGAAIPASLRVNVSTYVNEGNEATSNFIGTVSFATGMDVFAFYDSTGNPVTGYTANAGNYIVNNRFGATDAIPPTLQGAVSRKAHGGAGTFDLALNALATNPTTDPRSGGASGNHSIVFIFDKAVTGGTASVIAGVGTAGTPTFSGNEMVVPLSGVTNQQYVTVSVSDVAGADGSVGGTGSVRIGFLVGDANGNRVVTVSDLAQVNAQIAQVVTVSNYLKDVNASGTLTVADKGIANTQITKALPTP